MSLPDNPDYLAQYAIAALLKRIEWVAENYCDEYTEPAAALAIANTLHLLSGAACRLMEVSAQKINSTAKRQAMEYAAKFNFAQPTIENVNHEQPN